jgi:hypothetical protein
MNVILFIIYFSGLGPMTWAWHVNRSTSLVYAVRWAILAWTGWVTNVFLIDSHSIEAGHLAAYVALSLTGCAGVAVLGARRPHVGAWNFVVLGLLAVMILPLAEEFLVGPDTVGPLRFVFLAATLAVGILNYLPTCFAPAVALLVFGGGGELLLLAGVSKNHYDPEKVHVVSLVGLSLVPWAAFSGWRCRARATNAVDRLWLDFRNRFGLFWGQRVREQFNRSAANAGWMAFLSWRGLRGPGPLDPSAEKDMLQTLDALLKRFR